MIFTRWQAPIVPNVDQIRMILEAEGLIPYEEEYGPGAKVVDHRHPFDEVRVVAQGELFMNVAGNHILLRVGDRVEIPSNTRHETEVRGQETCLCICAKRPFKSISG